MKALVTGATGFVGFHIVQLLLAKDIPVKALVRKESDSSFLSKDGVAVSIGDIRDYRAVREAMIGCDHVFHAAADYRLWVRDPKPMYETNVRGTGHVMTAARDLGIEKVVYTSTAGTLVPGSKHKPSTETMPAQMTDLVGHYKKSKYLAEREVDRFVQQGVPVVIVNPTAPIGPGDRKPTPTGKIIVDFLNRKMPAYIDTGLNFVAVQDVALGHWLAATKGRTGERYLLGGDNMTLSQFLGHLAAVSGRKPPIARLPYGPLLVAAFVNECVSQITGRHPLFPLTAIRMARHYMFFESSKAERELGFYRTSVIDGMREAVGWYEANGYVAPNRGRKGVGSQV